MKSYLVGLAQHVLLSILSHLDSKPVPALPVMLPLLPIPYKGEHLRHTAAMDAQPVNLELHVKDAQHTWQDQGSPFPPTRNGMTPIPQCVKQSGPAINLCVVHTKTVLTV